MKQFKLYNKFRNAIKFYKYNLFNLNNVFTIIRINKIIIQNDLNKNIMNKIKIVIYNHSPYKYKKFINILLKLK